MKKKNSIERGAEARQRRLETLLMIVLPCISLFLAALVLIPAVQGYRERQERALAAAAELAEPEEFRLRIILSPSPEEYDLSDPFFGWRREGDGLYYIDNNGNALTGLQRIDGKLYYFAPDGKKARALGVDVSFYNEDVDWKAVKAQGIDFAIIRLGGRGWGSGALYGDIRTRQYLHNARKAGLLLGAYFYSTAGSEEEAAEEARAALRVLGGERLDLPVFIDVEESGEYPRGRSDKLSRSERTHVIDAFCRVIEAAGYEAGVYSGHYYYNSSILADAVSDRMIWIANYTASKYNVTPSFQISYAIWQFTDSGQVKGITGLSDLDVIF